MTKTFKMLVFTAAVMGMLAGSALAANLFVKEVDLSFIDLPDGTVLVRTTVEVGAVGTGKLAGIQVDGNLCMRTDDCSWHTGYTDRKGKVTFDRSYGYIQFAPAQFCVDNLTRNGDAYTRSLNVMECDTAIMQ